MTVNVLVVNFGATSTKIAVYTDNEETLSSSINHTKDDLQMFPTARDQKEYRKLAIKDLLEENNVGLNTIDAVATRAGILPPVNPGIYQINQAMMDYQKNFTVFDHITLVGTTLANELAQEAGPDVKGYIYDSESMDQLWDIAKITGSTLVPKSSLGHTLNIRSVVRKTAEEQDYDLNNSNFIVAHIGSGNTIAAVKDYEIVDMVSDDEGPFSSERSGRLSVRGVINVAYEKSKEEISKALRSEGGLYSHLGTNDGREVEERIQNGDDYAELVYKALAYQVAKACGELAVSLKGKVDGIIITGGLGYSEMLVNWIEEFTGHIAPLVLHAGEFEIESLAKASYRALVGEEEIQTFTYEEEKEK